MGIEVKKTTYKVQGCKEKCWEITNGSIMVRIAKLYHLIGRDTIVLTEYNNGNYQNDEEWDIDFDTITKSDALRIAKQFSIYL